MIDVIFTGLLQMYVRCTRSEYREHDMTVRYDQWQHKCYCTSDLIHNKILFLWATLWFQHNRERIENLSQPFPLTFRGCIVTEKWIKNGKNRVFVFSLPTFKKKWIFKKVGKCVQLYKYSKRQDRIDESGEYDQYF